MRARALLVLSLLAVPLSGCIVPENMTALREDLGYTSVELPDVVAKARASTLTPRVSETVTLTADVEGIPLEQATIRWTIADEEIPGRSIQRSFDAPGTVPVNLTVTGPEGTRGTDALTLDVRENAVPQPAISIEDAQTLTDGEQTTFSALASTDADGDDLTYRWTIDGEAVSTNATFERTLAAGTHAVELFVSDGLQDAVVFDAYAVDLPIDRKGEVAIEDARLYVPVTVQEGASGLEATLTHTTRAGLEDVQLVLVDPDGEEIAASRSEPAPGASAAQESIEVPQDDMIPGPYTLQARLDRGVQAEVSIEGVLTYSALAAANGT